MLPKLPARSINCCITSPPFWALRDYGLSPQIWGGDKNCEHKFSSSIRKRQTGGLTEKQTTNKGSYFDSSSQFCSLCGAWRGCLGLEPTFELYIKHLCDIYDEVKRVLRKDGTCFVNLGDTYNNNTPGSRDPDRWPKQSRNDHTPNKRPPASVRIKSLCLIPQRFAIEMVNRGWILRNVIVWHKPNPMPSSAKDRFTVDFEYVYFFVKNKRYWFEPQYEPHTRDWSGCGGNLAGKGTHKLNDGFKNIGDRTELSPNPLGRNKRTVWTIPTQAYSEAHFATFPEKLVEPMIKSGCPEFVCKKCGKAREKIYDVSYEKIGSGTVGGRGRFTENDNSGFTGKPTMARLNHFKGYTDCGCKGRKEYRPGIVLDMFRRFGHGRSGSRLFAA